VSAPDLSVVLVNWNGLAITSAALESLREHTRGITYEVTVVDNGSTADASRTELPARFPWVNFVANPVNLGFTRANNQAIRTVRGRHVLLLNSDTVQTENALGAAVDYMDANPHVGALGIMHRNADAERTFQLSFGRFPDPVADVLGVCGLGRRPTPPRVAEQDVDYVCGSFLMIRRECLEAVGLLDERFFAYDEDIDWCWRARRAGWAVRFWPGVSMVHLGSAAAPYLRDKTGLMYRSHLVYLRKHHPSAAPAYFLAMAGRLGLAVVKAGLRAAVGRAGRADVAQRWARLRGFVFPGRAAAG
jgi:GT2 family glycosyltransferase